MTHLKKSFIEDPRVEILEAQIDEIGSKSLRPNITEAYIIWSFPILAQGAGFAVAEIYDRGVAAGIHPPDAGRVWLNTNDALLVEVQEALPKDDQLARSFAVWLEDEANKLKEAGDPAYELISAIAMEVLEAEEGPVGSDQLYGAARDADDHGDHLLAHHCCKMTELVEEDELLRDLHGNNVIWKTTER